MKNYLQRLDLERIPDDKAELRAALDTAASDQLDRQTLADAEAVLSDPVVGEYYLRLHRQYEALSLASCLLDKELACNSHRWKERLVEFEPEDDTLYLPG